MKAVSFNRKITSIAVLFFLQINTAFSIFIHVPDDQPTISAAIKDASSGDVIVIAPGTYEQEKKILIDKQITITSQWYTTGDTQFITKTIFDGVSKKNSLFETVNGKGVDVEISGLTIKRFRYPLIIEDSVVIQHNFFSNNDQDTISFEGASSGYVGFNTLEDSGDDAIDIDAREGNFVIEFNTIRNSRDNGIEIRLLDNPRSNMLYEIHDNIINGNDEDGMQLIDHTLNDSGQVFKIYNNIFDSNTMTGLGLMFGGDTTKNFGGADILERVLFHNNTVINNTVGVTGGDNLIALNNIIAFNKKEGVKRLHGDSVIAHSIFYQNGTNISDSVIGSGVLLDVDPEYDAITYDLLVSSPSIDVGVAEFIWNGERVLNRNASEYIGTQPDLGGKEFSSGGDGELAASDSMTIHDTNGRDGEDVFLQTLETAFFEAKDYAYLYGIAEEVDTVKASDNKSIKIESDQYSTTKQTLVATEQDVMFFVWVFGNESNRGKQSRVTSYGSDGVEAALSSENSWTKMPGVFSTPDGSWPLILHAGEEGAIWNRLIFTTDPDFVPDNNQGPTLNKKPIVNAGVDQLITLSDSVSLNGSVIDDNNDILSIKWRKIEGDGHVVFADPASEKTTATFSQKGTYVLELEGDDGLLKGSDQLTVTVNPVTNKLDIRISASNDDAEEKPSGKISLTSSDLELVNDGSSSNTQLVGMRFNNLFIPPNAIITHAYIQFQVDEKDSKATSLIIEGEDTDDALTFKASTGNISERARTLSLVVWTPSTWRTVGDAGSKQRTPNINEIIQEIVGRSGWSQGNSLAIIVTGSGERTAESFNGDSSAAPLLHIEYILDDDRPNQAPVAKNVVMTGEPKINQVLTGSYTYQDTDGDIEGDSNYRWLRDGLPIDGAILQSYRLVGADESTRISFEVTPIANTGTFLGKTVQSTVIGPVKKAGDLIEKSISIRISSGTDDAEEKVSSGKVALNSSDLELVDEGKSSRSQLVGVRFNNIAIPQGAVITHAHIQFQTDEKDSIKTSLIIEGEASDNAVTFDSSNKNISARRRTQASIDWVPAEWASNGESSVKQKTPDMRSIVQEIIDRHNWSENNSLVFIVSGNGERTAESFNGDSSAAPLLHIEFTQ